jgi:hypothetical protein
LLKWSHFERQINIGPLKCTFLRNLVSLTLLFVAEELLHRKKRVRGRSGAVTLTEPKEEESSDDDDESDAGDEGGDDGPGSEEEPEVADDSGDEADNDDDNDDSSDSDSELEEGRALVNLPRWRTCGADRHYFMQDHAKVGWSVVTSFVILSYLIINELVGSTTSAIVLFAHPSFM